MNICIFGDSITWGASDFEKSGWVERLKSHCLEKYDDVNIYNLGIPGNTTNDLLKRFKSEAIIREPDLIIFAIGINDSGYEEEKNKISINLKFFRKNIIKLVKIAKKITNKIIFIGLTRVDESKTKPIECECNVYYENEIIEKFDTTLKEISKENNFDYIEMKNILSNEDLDDGLHPNSNGHEKIFQEVLKNIEKFL